MKFLLLSLLLLSSFCIRVIAADAPAADSWKTTAAWSMDTATKQGGGLVLLEKTGHEPLVLPKAGVTVDAVPGSASGNALIFDGTQKAAVNTVTALDLGASAEFSLSFKPSTGGTQMQTLLKTNETYEIRLTGQSTRLDFIISLPDKKYFLVHLPYKADAWNTLRARLQDGRLTLKVNDAEVVGNLPDRVQPAPKPNRVLIGWYGERVYTGAMADLVIRVP
jgi:hypothetical protein